jgi:hypothetical protein
LNGNVLTIENYTNDYTYDQILELENKISKAYFDDSNYYLAAKYITEMERACGLSAKGYKWLCYSYFKLDKVDNCIDAANRFENNCPDESESEEAANIYQFLANVLENNRYSSFNSKYSSYSDASLLAFSS